MKYQRIGIRLDERIRRLKRLRNGLDHCIGCGCLSLNDCLLRNPDDILGKRALVLKCYDHNEKCHHQA